MNKKLYCCRKFKRFDKKYGGTVLLFDDIGYREFREMWGLNYCIFCRKELSLRP